jgi:thiamine-phosphate pyrophosphorylase
MPEDIAVRTRLCLVTRPAADLAALSRDVGDALSGGDVASLIVTGDPADPSFLQRAAQALVPIAQNAGAATMIHNDTQVAGRARADGVHVDTGLSDLRSAIGSFHPKRMVGAGGFHSRHEAMAAGEADPDYLFFGRLGDEAGDGIHPASRDLAAWWSSVTVIPAIVMGGRALASVEEAAAEGIEFVALSAAVWDDPRGPRAAVADACERLAAQRERAA